MFPSYQLFEQHSNPSYHTPTQDHQLYATCCEHRRQLRDSQTPEIFKPDIRHFLRDVSYFKYDIVDKIPYHQIVVGDDEEVSEVILELRDMGVEFVEVLRSLANVLKAADHGD